MNKRSGLYLGSLVALVALGAVVWTLLDHSPPRPPQQQETGLRILTLSGPAAGTDAELSGMAWWGDTLLLLPQFPERFDHTIFAIARADVERAVDGDDTPLTIRQVPFVAPVVDERENDGYEAIAIDGDDVFLTLEVSGDENRPTVGRLLRGSVEGDLERIIVDEAPPVPLEAQNHIANIAYEALLLQPDRVIALYETNGVVNPNPRALVFDRELTPRGALPMGPVEYRITDATTLDAAGRFWVTNYHWPGAPWHTGTCEITERFGQGESHARCRTVERLLELQLTEQGIRPTDRAPIQLQLLDDEHPRNWEGLVRLDDRGFLLVTDEHPSTILAFVPAP
ncbi:MAG: hypothetical protein H6719_27715 [Sandaracinaceae bacterium]|nr:hypothetical protein [Sandaracinaceae bacterium]